MSLKINLIPTKLLEVFRQKNDITVLKWRLKVSFLGTNSTRTSTGKLL